MRTALRLKFLFNVILLALTALLCWPAMAQSFKLCHKEGPCFQINPNTLAVSLVKDGEPIRLSEPVKWAPVSHLQSSDKQLTFVRLGETVQCQNKPGYLRVAFSGSTTGFHAFPLMPTQTRLILPMLEGLVIPAKDDRLVNYLMTMGSNASPFDGTADLSMPFLMASYHHFAALWIAENPYNNRFWFQRKNGLTLHFGHEINKLNRQKPFAYRLYITQDTPAAAANIYRHYKKQQHAFKSLADKAKVNPNVKQLYGAPFIYLWQDELIGLHHIHRHKLLRTIKQDQRSMAYLKRVAKRHSINAQVLERVAHQDWICRWDLTEFDKLMRQLVLTEDLYQPDFFKKMTVNSRAKRLIERGVNRLSASETVELHKALIASIFGDALDPVRQWGNGVSTPMIKSLVDGGIKHAWLGLNDRSDGVIHQDAIRYATKHGYLIGPYDSYNSIQKQGHISIPTAAFHDESLYERAAVINEQGRPKSGFLSRGHLLNAAFAKPELRYRLALILNDEQVPFNAWFFDCYGAGDLNNDFSKQHPTSEALDARNKVTLMQWAADHYALVIGTEDGKDYAAPYIAFGHGIVNPVIWDLDMVKHRDSPYYMGSYYSPVGIPPRYAKPTPLKPIVKHVYFNPSLDVPLYQLVYNDSVIVADHWEYGTFKFPEVVTYKLLKSFLYNHPPLLHLDLDYWRGHRQTIVPYLKAWSRYAGILCQQTMTDFHVLSSDRLLQQTVFSNGMTVTVNFSKKAKRYDNRTLDGHSVLIEDQAKQQLLHYHVPSAI